MSDNPQPASAQEFRLPGHDVLSITGPDALAFAQAQFMNDVTALADGQWQWNGWLTPKGRVIALFALLRLDARTLWLVLPNTDATDLASKLQRYVFRSKLALQARGDLHASAAFAAPAAASGARFAIDGDRVELDCGGEGGPRTLRLAPVVAADNDASVVQWRRYDLRHGLPRLAGGQVEAWTPQQLSLERLRAFSVRKGCYPGQEIVARTHFLGQAKRGLALYRARAPIAEGAPIEDEGRGIGSVVCVEDDTVLGVVPGDTPSEGLRAGGVSLVPLPLLGGLAR